MDGTGPTSRGRISGRGLGPCGGGAGFGGRGRGSGRGFGRGAGRGYGCVEPVVLSSEEQKKILKAELEDIEAEKQEIEKKLKEL